MDTIRCTCGAAYRVKKELAGKRVKCKHCSNKITFPMLEVAQPAAAEHDDFDWAALTDGQAVARAVGDSEEAVVARPVVVEEDRPRARVPNYEKGSLVAYLKDCAWSFAFIAEPSSIITFGVMALVWAAAPLLWFAPCLLAILAQIVLHAWYFGYLFQVMEQAASGEHELPVVTPEGEWWETAISPIFKFIAVSVFTFGPAILLTYLRWETVQQSGTIWQDPWIVVALAFGVFMVPMFLLVVALGGIACLARVDLMVRTVVQSFPGYLVAFLAVAAATVANWLVIEAVGAKLNPTNLTDTLALTAVLRIADFYLAIVTMQIVGFYYHHFKSRFAWSWG